MRSFTRSLNRNHLVRYMSLHRKSGPRNAFRPRLPNWQFFGLSPAAHAPVPGSTTETTEPGFCNGVFPVCGTQVKDECGTIGTPGTTTAYTVAQPTTMT